MRKVKVKGSAIRASCASTTAQKGDNCYGFHCGVTEADLAAEAPAKCTYQTPEAMCSGEIARLSTQCASEAATVANLLTGNEAVRSAFLKCVFKVKPEMEEQPRACLDCFQEALLCVQDACLTQCAGGITPACERCRIESGCQEQGMLCQGQPSPF